MARIPIAQIPNAPQLAQPVVTPTGAPRVSLMAAAQNLQQESMPLDSFSGAAKGLEALGEAGQRVSAVLQDFSLKMAAVQDESNLAKADKIYNETYAQYQQELQTLRPEEWGPKWLEKEEGLRRSTGELAMSARARRQLDAFHDRFVGNAAIQIRTLSNKRVIEQGREEVAGAFGRMIEAGNAEGAAHYLSKSSLYTEPQKQAMITQATQLMREKSRIAMNEMITADIAADPNGTLTELTKATQGEANKYGIMDKNHARGFIRTAEIERDWQSINLQDQLHKSVIEGKITDKASLNELADGRLSEARMQSLEKVMGPEIAFDAEVYSKIQTRIKSYSAADDNGMAEYNDIISTIETNVPQNLQGALISQVTQTWHAMVKESKRPTHQQLLLGELLSDLDKLGDKGLLGPTGKDQDGKIIDPMQHLKTWGKIDAIKQRLQMSMEKDPEVDGKKAREYMKTLIGAEAAENAAARFAKLANEAGRSNPLRYSFTGNRPPPSTEAIRKKIRHP
jgi:hypothetical protein